MIPKAESEAIATGARVDYYRPSWRRERRYPHEVNMKHYEVWQARRRARRGEAVAA